jgi:flagellin-specific chaperone FliS
MNNKLIEGNIKKDVAPLNEVKQHLEELREAWVQAAKEVSSNESREPVVSSAGGINIAT